MQPKFHHSMIEFYGEIMSQYAIRHEQGWQDGTTVDMCREMRDLTLNIVVKTLFSIDLPSEVRRLGVAFEVSNQYISARFNQLEPIRALLHTLPLLSTLRFKRELAYVDNVVYGLIEQRRRTGYENGDLLSLMLRAEDDRQDDPAASRMTDRQVRDETVTMFAVGHETVAIALTWTWYLLAAYQELQARWHKELDEVLGGRNPTLDDLEKLKFTEQIITESMRLYPPIWRTGRVVLEPLELGGYQISTGTLLCIAPIVTHRDERWYQNPMAFDPDRWTPEFREGLHRFAYFPFGGGPRLCIGEGFAWMEAKLIMAAIGQRWRVSPCLKGRSLD